MKRVWRSRRGNALPLAIGTMLVVFALCGLLLSLALYANRLSLVNKQYFDQRLELDSIAQECRILLERGKDFEEWDVAEKYSAFSVELNDETGDTATVGYDGGVRVYNSGTYRLTVTKKGGTNVLLTVEFFVGDGQTVTVNRWVYGGLSDE